MKSLPEKPSLLICGLGSIGERHLRCFQASSRFIVSACEPDAELRSRISAKYNCPAHASIAEALSTGSFDAAVICAPAHLHIPLATECVRNGLHVLIEKPLAVTLEGVEELKTLAETSDRIVRVAYTTRSNPLFQDLKAILMEGKIGSIRQVSVVSGQDFAALRPAYRNTYYVRHESGGGAIQDALTHLIHTTEWLAAPIRSVTVQAAHLVLEGVEVEDTVNLSAVLCDGTLAAFCYNQFQAPNETTVALHGTTGSVRVELHKFRIGYFSRGEAAWTEIDRPAFTTDHLFTRQAVSFHDTLQGTSNRLCTLDEAAQSVRVSLAALESARTRKEVAIS